MRDWIKKTREIAELSDYHKPGRRTGALVIKKGKVLSVGFNKMKNRIGVRTKYKSFTMHAEIDALEKINGKARGATIIILRQKGGISLPCSNCYAAIFDSGLRKIIYEDSDKNIIEYIIK